MNRLPELKPTKYDVFLAAAVGLLAALLAARFWFTPAPGMREVVVSAGGEEVERLPLQAAERIYENNGYTVRLSVTPDGARVSSADCPTQDCVRTGEISQAGQSIICLPARIVIRIEGGGSASYDVVAG